ncbi:LysR family transcriptional regulator [Paenibacillaceae bacterium]|nr:LysR family transcriptional regulator [Paenibacillaceae bacterium]
MLEEMHVFATVVEQSSLNRASTMLNLSQPALSRRMVKLENELGVELFRRVGKRLELTKIGQLTYAYALELRSMHLRYLQSVAEFQSGDRITLTVGASLTTLQTTLPDLIQIMTEIKPELDIKAVTGKTHEIVSLVRERKVDIGVVASQINDPALRSVALFDDHLQLVLPRNQFVSEKALPTIEDLNSLPMILFSKGTWYRIMTDELFNQYHLAPDVRMEIDSFEAILRLLQTCRAATLLPKSYLRQQLVEDNELSVIPIRELEQTKRTTSLIAAHPSGTSGPPIHAWLDEIAAYYARMQHHS